MLHRHGLWAELSLEQGLMILFLLGLLEIMIENDSGKEYDDVFSYTVFCCLNVISFK